MMFGLLSHPEIRYIISNFSDTSDSNLLRTLRLVCKKIHGIIDYVSVNKTLSLVTRRPPFKSYMVGAVVHSPTTAKFPRFMSNSQRLCIDYVYPWLVYVPGVISIDAEVEVKTDAFGNEMAAAKIQKLIESMPFLTSLSIRSCEFIGDKICNFVTPRMTEITLDVNVTDDMVRSVAERVGRNMVKGSFGTRLAFPSSAHQLTTESILTLAKNCPNLKYVSISFTREGGVLTDEHICALMTSCRDLRYIRLLWGSWTDVTCELTQRSIDYINDHRAEVTIESWGRSFCSQQEVSS
jgi:hypothetical protein